MMDTLILSIYLLELGQLSGIAAILRFPIEDPQDEDSSDEEGWSFVFKK